MVCDVSRVLMSLREDIISFCQIYLKDRYLTQHLFSFVVELVLCSLPPSFFSLPTLSILTVLVGMCHGIYHQWFIGSCFDSKSQILWYPSLFMVNVNTSSRSCFLIINNYSVINNGICKERDGLCSPLVQYVAHVRLNPSFNFQETKFKVIM